VIRALPALFLATGCWRGGGATPAAAAPPERQESVQLCAEYSFKILSDAVIVVNGSTAAPAFDDANAQANHDAELAGGAARTDMAAAARHYLACAARFRAVPDDDPLRHTAHYNAVGCYQNAMYAFAMAGRFSAEGKPALERAIRQDPRLAPELRRMLASPPSDCAVRR
jgi:hypothetical protein